jgi:phage baseplate assembly protein gpV
MRYDDSEINKALKINAANLVRTADLFEVINFYPETQTVDIQACVKPFVVDMDGEIRKNMYGDYVKMSQNQETLILLNVPVQQFRCGQFSITAPLSVGDVGIVHFLKNDIDKWRVEGGVTGTYYAYPYDLNSCVFSPFIPNEKTKDVNFNANSLEIKSKSVIIRVNEETVDVIATESNITSNVKIKGNVDVDGQITATGDVVGGGISLMTHVHSYEDTQPNGTPVTKSTQPPQ